ncbi:ATP-binding protein [Haloferula sp.]|uniref:ATP-binding protein n=1 Tax=Haloferula sp. TaxID=2497595 RepID=UPI003C78BAA7
MTPRVATATPRLLAASLLLLLAQSLIAETSIAQRFSQYFRDLEEQVAEIDRELLTLPDIPQDDSGGMEAYARHYASIDQTHDLEIDSAIRFTWEESAPVDLVALIPARKFTPQGLAPEYGFPDNYNISLIDSSGKVIATIAEERGTLSSSLNRGFPFVHRLEKPMEAHGVELRITRLRPPQPGGPPIHFFAISELFCFSGERNLIPGAEISFNYDETTNSTPYWNPSFISDELTPLGLPEQPLSNGETWKRIGWITNGKPTENFNEWITVDLESPQIVDGLRLFPAKRPSLVTVPGFGIPQRYWIEVSQTGARDSYSVVVEPTVLDLPNPGDNPITVRFPPVRARFVRMRAEKLWKPFQHYPAFMASSEIQVLRGEENLALGKPLRVSENKTPFAAHGEHFWSAESLTDGYGPKGKLLTRKAWLDLLDQRKQLEIRRRDTLAELENIERRWSVGTSIGLAVLGVGGLLAVVFLPIRFRLRERRKIRTIRDRIASDLHDDVGSNLGSIQLLSGTARSKPRNDEELRLIDQIAAETVTSVRDIVWLLRPKPGDRVSTIAHLRESASFLLDSIEWNFESTLEDFAVGDEGGRDLVLFFREALHNLIRHSGATRAEISIDRIGNELCLHIEDNGCGIPKDRLHQEGTLRALKERSKALGGKLSVDSEVGRGTILKLFFTPQPPSSRRSLRYPFPNRS